MSKVKRILAVVLAMAMVMAMSVTVFAKRGDTDGSITVSGLAKEETEVTIYKIISLAEGDNGWEVAEGVDAGAVDLTTDPVKIRPDDITLASLVPAQTPKTTSDGTVTFTGLEEGAYLVIARSKVPKSETAYNRMVGVTYTYNETTGLIEGKDAEITAKSSTIDVTKEADTNFVGVGTEVTFTISTTFPSFYTQTGGDTTGTYRIVDTPSGMRLDSVEAVKVDGVILTVDRDYTVTENNSAVTFTSDFIGNTNTHAGQSVEVTYKGTVTDGDNYTNKANAYKDDQSIGEDEIPEHFTGTINFSKYAEEGLETDESGNVTGTLLVGAEFTVHEILADNTRKLLYFIGANGVYKQVPEGTEGAVSQVVVAADGENKGTVSLTYLEAGNYEITEVVAPEGYSVDGVAKPVTITANEEADVTVNSYMTDTKLSALPSTGGAGIIVFTIIGCVIMIGAAAMFFLSGRKKEE